MKFPLRAIGGFIAGFITLVACCAAQTAGGASSGQTNPATAQVTQNSAPPAKAEPAASQAPYVSPDVPGPVRQPEGKSGPAAVSPKAAGAANQASVDKPYVIGPLDVLDVSVWNDAKLSHIYDVAPDGTISMPLIGVVKADGLTGAELAAAIRDKLLQVLNTPEVNVQVVRNNSKKFYVFGAVNRPGEFPLTAKTTVLDAFANTAGFKDFANLKKIRILRGTREYFFNYKDVSRGRHMEQNIVLENGDRIFVAE